MHDILSGTGYADSYSYNVLFIHVLEVILLNIKKSSLLSLKFDCPKDSQDITVSRDIIIIYVVAETTIEYVDLHG